MNISGEWVDLSLSEMLNACVVGGLRHYQSTEKGLLCKHGFDASKNSPLAIHVDGACGEIAVAKLRGRYFGGLVNSFKAADLGDNVQVRTRSSHDYDLIVRSNDNPEHIYVLVTGAAPRLCVRGWLYGHEAQQDSFLRAYGGREAAYFVPAQSLRPVTRKKEIAEI